MAPCLIVKVASLRARKATLQNLAARGVHVALATGRRRIITSFLPPLLEIPLFLILSNGAVIRDHTGAISYESYLPSEWAWRAVGGGTSP